MEILVNGLFYNFGSIVKYKEKIQIGESSILEPEQPWRMIFQLSTSETSLYQSLSMTK